MDSEYVSVNSRDKHMIRDMVDWLRHAGLMNSSLNLACKYVSTEKELKNGDGPGGELFEARTCLLGRIQRWQCKVTVIHFTRFNRENCLLAS